MTEPDVLHQHRHGARPGDRAARRPVLRLVLQDLLGPGELWPEDREHEMDADEPEDRAEDPGAELDEGEERPDEQLAAQISAPPQMSSAT